ncbi:hypothetical protein IP97_02289 [Flavobacterium cheniae]|uniref:Uncharacterized protein n=1 Tax=Flavobacterium cheniae TaxID=295428 RepID=A0A562KC44_9FLAO|nr:hypothetical protein IP97_02289 [Flavobacterium cheniae]
MNTNSSNLSLINSKEMKLLKRIGYIVLVVTILVYFILVFQFCRNY